MLELVVPYSRQTASGQAAANHTALKASPSAKAAADEPSSLRSAERPEPERAPKIFELAGCGYN